MTIKCKAKKVKIFNLIYVLLIFTFTLCVNTSFFVWINGRAIYASFLFAGVAAMLSGLAANKLRQMFKSDNIGCGKLSKKFFNIIFAAYFLILAAFTAVLIFNRPLSLLPGDTIGILNAALTSTVFFVSAALWTLCAVYINNVGVWAHMLFPFIMLFTRTAEYLLSSFR